MFINLLTLDLCKIRVKNIQNLFSRINCQFFFEGGELIRTEVQKIQQGKIPKIIASNPIRLIEPVRQNF